MKKYGTSTFIKKYDKNNNCIYEKMINNDKTYEQWNDYDENGNMIHHKDSNGFESWADYDENGNMIHHKDSNGFESKYKYNEYGDIIYVNNNYHGEIIEISYENKYDENNRLIYSKNIDTGTETWYEYDKNGNIICTKNTYLLKEEDE